MVAFVNLFIFIDMKLSSQKKPLRNTCRTLKSIYLISTTSFFNINKRYNLISSHANCMLKILWYLS